MKILGPLRGALSIALGTAATSLATALAACASEESDVFVPPPPNVPAMPSPPEADAGADADAAAGDTCTSDDCAFFPPECTPDVLCPTGPFDQQDPTRGLPLLTNPRVLVGRSPNDVWLAGTLGAYARFDGSSWSTLDAGSPMTPRVLWLTPSGEVAVGDRGSLLVRGSSFVTSSEPSPDGFAEAVPVNRPNGLQTNVRAGFAPPGSTTLWIATYTPASVAPASGALMRLVAMQDGTIEVRPGIETARCVQGCERVRSIHGASGKTLFAVGEHGAAVRIDDADSDEPRLSPFNSATTMGLWGVFVLSDTDVWAVGGRGTVRRYEGGVAWKTVEGVPTSANLNAVWAASSNDVWVAGDDGVVLHYDGTAWSRMKIAGLGARRPHMTAIWGTTAGTVYVAGQGIVLSLGGRP